MKIKKDKSLGKFILSAEGLRRMADGLEKARETTGDVEVSIVASYYDSNKKKTIGMNIKKGE